MLKYTHIVLFIIFNFITDLSAQPEKGLFYGEASDNFIIRWEFQDISDHVFDPRTGVKDQPSTVLSTGLVFDPKDVRPGDIIFVRKIGLFMDTMNDKIEVPYILLTHGDFLDTVRENDIDYLDDEKIIAWFSIHPPKRFHEKFYPIPLGVKQNREHYMQKETYNTLFKELRKRPKETLVSITFNDAQNPERKIVLDALGDQPYCLRPTKKRMSFESYLETLAACKFSLSPRGWGPDCYRTWEALLVGSIPIVTRGEYDVMDCAKKYLRNNFGRYNRDTITSNLDRLYQDLPVLVIDDWSEISQEFLEKKYKEITSQKYDIEKLYIEYWYEKIVTVQQTYLDEYYSNREQGREFDSDDEDLLLDKSICFRTLKNLKKYIQNSRFYSMVCDVEK